MWRKFRKRQRVISSLWLWHKRNITWQKKNLASTDTLYRIGQQRHRIAAISQADLLTLKLDRVNAQNTLQNKASDLKRAMFSLASFLNLDKNTQIELELPSRPGMLEIPIDEALRWGRSNNPQLLELKQNVLEAERNVDKTKRSRVLMQV